MLTDTRIYLISLAIILLIVGCRTAGVALPEGIGVLDPENPDHPMLGTMQKAVMICGLGIFLLVLANSKLSVTGVITALGVGAASTAALSLSLIYYAKTIAALTLIIILAVVTGFGISLFTKGGFLRWENLKKRLLKRKE